MNTTVDKKLIHAAQRGSPKAFHQVVRSFDWPVLQLALRITGTEQAAQAIYLETMLSMHARLAAFQCECSLYLCAYSIVAQLCLDYLRGDRGRAVEAIASGKGGSVLISLSARERLVLLRACHKLRAALGER